MSAELSKIKLTNDQTYNLKDATARADIANLTETIDLSSYQVGDIIPDNLVKKFQDSYYKKAIYNELILDVHECVTNPEVSVIVLENIKAREASEGGITANNLIISKKAGATNYTLEEINTQTILSSESAYTIDIIDSTTYTTMGQLYNHWLENNTAKKRVIYDLHEFIENGYMCLLYFWHYNNMDYCQIESLLRGESYINYDGYTADRLISDYVNNKKQKNLRIIKLNSTNATLSRLKDIINKVNNVHDYILIDVSALSASRFLLSAYITETQISFFDVVTHSQFTVDYAEDTLITDCLAHLEVPIKVVNKLPDTAVSGQLVTLVGNNYQPVTVLTDLVVGQTYRLFVPSTQTTVPTTLLGRGLFMSNISNVVTSLERNTAISFTEDLSNYKPGLIATANGKIQALAYAIDYDNNTIDGYDFTNGLGDQGLIIDFTFTGVYNMFETFSYGWLSKFDRSARPTYLYRENKWNLLATSHEIDSIYSTLATTIPLDGYQINDQIETATVEALIKNNYKIEKGSYQYSLVEHRATDTYEYLTYAVPKSDKTQAYFDVIVLWKDLTTATPIWILSDLMQIQLGIYESGGTFRIDLPENKNFKLIKDNISTNIIQGDQTADVNLTLPATSGTLALKGDLDITAEKISQALGYTPYNSANPNNYISDYTVTSNDVVSALGFTPYNATNPNNYITKTDITKADIISKLGYTPYNETNPNKYISSYTVTNADVINALGYTPYSNTNPDKYLKSITSAQVTNALGFTPYNATNPAGYISEITSADVTNALGFTPYNSSNPNNYITASAHNLTYYYDKQYIDDLASLGFEAIIVATKPTSPLTGKVYLIPVEGQTDVYEEWIWVSDGTSYSWKKLGTTSIDMTAYAKKTDLNSIAFTGAYSALVGAPTIPTNVSQLTNDSNYIKKDVSNLVNYTKTSDLATVATTGSYNDLLDQPTIPTQTSQLENNSGYVTTSQLPQTNVSTFINDGDGTYRYATLEDIQVLEQLDPDAIQHAIDIAETVGSVSYVAGGTGLTGSGDKTITINHANSITANTSYPTGTTLVNGGSFTVRDVKYDDTGHITGYQDRTINMTEIPAYDDTEVKSLITAAETHIDTVETDVNNHFAHLIPSVKFYALSLLGTEPYIDPTTLQPVADRYYTNSDIINPETEVIDNEKLDVCLKAWTKYKFGWNTPEELEKCSFYVLAKNDHNEYVNHLCNFWTSRTNTTIATYPDLCQVGCFCDDGYGSTPLMSSTTAGVIDSISQDGYIYALDSKGHASIYGWGDLKSRVTTLEDTIGDINTLLDSINGEVI